LSKRDGEKGRPQQYREKEEKKGGYYQAKEKEFKKEKPNQSFKEKKMLYK
jgi:hypothetical protein